MSRNLGKLLIVSTITVMMVALLLSGPGMAQNGLSPIELLGEELFFDENLSTPPGQACAACHAPEWGFTGPDPAINAGQAIYPGVVHTRAGNRKPPGRRNQSMKRMGAVLILLITIFTAAGAETYRFTL